MKVAVCLYGYPRQVEYGKKSLDYFLDGIEHDFYIHSWCDKNITDDDYQKTISQIHDSFKPKAFVMEKQIDFPNSFEFECDLSALKREFVEAGIAISATLSPLYSILKVSELLEESKQNYDMVILTRTDVFSVTQLKDYQFENYDDIYSSFCHGEMWNLNGSGDAIDAKMIMSSQKNMNHFFKIYNLVETYLRDEKIRLCQHRLFAHHLKKLNTKFQMIFGGTSNWFYIRSNGHLEGELVHSNIKNFPIFQ